MPEPIEKWQNVVGRNKMGEATSFNLLDEFYRAPERYAYTFQNWVFFTRFLQVRCGPRLRSSRRSDLASFAPGLRVAAPSA